ncbi:unnamed protein product, partial [Candidula unifasciata]
LLSKINNLFLDTSGDVMPYPNLIVTFGDELSWPPGLKNHRVIRIVAFSFPRLWRFPPPPFFSLKKGVT